MNENRLQTARQIVADVLAVRAVAEGTGVFRMHAVEPEHGNERQRLATRFAHMVPLGSTVGDMERLAMAIAPFITTPGAVFRS